MIANALDAASLAAVTGGGELTQCRQYRAISWAHRLLGYSTMGAIYDGRSDACRNRYVEKHPDIFHWAWSRI